MTDILTGKFGSSALNSAMLTTALKKCDVFRIQTEIEEIEFESQLYMST